MWYSQRVTRRRKFCIHAKSRSTFHRLRYRRSLRPSWGEADGKNVFHKLALGRRSASDRLRTRAQHPQHIVQHCAGVMPWTTTIIRPSSPEQNRLDDQPLFIGRPPAPCNSALAGSHRAISACYSFQLQRSMRLILVQNSTVEERHDGTTSGA